MAVYDLRGYVDLGLPSGKLWATDNEKGYFNFHGAMYKFKDKLPTNDDWEELFANTNAQVDLIQNGIALTGANGNSLFLPYSGRIDCKNNLFDANRFGYYWTFNLDKNGNTESRLVLLCSGTMRTYYNWDWWSKYPVRLIKAK